jgi:hypothetical protein
LAPTVIICEFGGAEFSLWYKDEPVMYKAEPEKFG